MKALVLGSGMMGRAIAFDLSKFSDFEEINLVDQSKKPLKSAEKMLKGKKINFDTLDVRKTKDVEKQFKKNDVIISAIPYFFNLKLTEMAIKTNSHFIDLGGNNTVVEDQLKLCSQAEENKSIIIPDCGLAPGLVSIITKEIVETIDDVESVKLRVGGLPVTPVPPFNYQIVFSPNGLINEYVEDAIILDEGKIVSKESMTELEIIDFPYPFSKMEAFLTSGGCSTLPYTFKDKIKYLDYKTIRYPGHCQHVKPLLDLGFASEKPTVIDGKQIIPRKLLIDSLLKNIPTEGKDVVLLKVLGNGKNKGQNIEITYELIDYCDEENNISAMMRTTGFPVSIIAQLIEKNLINKCGVFTSEEIIPCNSFFTELDKRDIKLVKKVKNI